MVLVLERQDVEDLVSLLWHLPWSHDEWEKGLIETLQKFLDRDAAVQSNACRVPHGP